MEKANKKKFEEQFNRESQSLEDEENRIRKEQAKLLEEVEFLQESLSHSMSQIEVFNNTPSISINTPIESKSLTPDTSMYSVFKENPSSSISIQTENSKDIDIQTETGKNEKVIRKKKLDSKENYKKVLEKALESSMRIEKIFSNDSSVCEDFKFFPSISEEKSVEKTLVEKNPEVEDEMVVVEDEMIVIEDSFYDSGILDVINEMEDYEN